MSYSSYDHDNLETAETMKDNLETAETMKIERRIYFESEKSDLSGLAALPLSELLSMRSESAAAEQAVFDRLKEQAAAWEEQAGKTLTLDKAIEYARTPPAKHTSNQWEAPDSYRHVRSNAVYQMSYSISENTRYDSKAQKSIPYSWTLRWSIYTNAPGTYGQAKIAGQERKVFASREELDKYLNGRIKPALVYGNLPAHSQGVRRLFQGKRPLASRLYRRGGRTPAGRRASQAGGTAGRTAGAAIGPAAGCPCSRKEGTRERSIFDYD